MTTPMLGFTDPRRRSSNLSDVQSVLSELDRLYQATRTNQLEPHHARELRNILRTYGDLLSGAIFEERLRTLETLLAAKPRQLEVLPPEPDISLDTKKHDYSKAAKQARRLGKPHGTP